MSEDMFVVIVTSRHPKQTNVMITVAAYVTNDAYRAAELMEQAEKETGGTACINIAPYEYVDQTGYFIPMEVPE